MEIKSPAYKRKMTKQTHNGLPECKLTPLSWREYNHLFQQVRRSNLLQSPVYAKTARLVYNQTASPYLFEYKGGNAAIALVLEAGIFKNAVHGVILDRGPLWLGHFGSADHLCAFFEQFNSAYPPRFGRRRRILPECADTAPHRQALQQTALKRLPNRPGYQTIWVDLTKEEEALRTGLKGKWRNALRKAEKSGLSVSWSHGIKQAALILACHNQDKTAKRYQGTSLKTLSVLCRQAVQGQGLLSAVAQLNGRMVAGVIFIRHGLAATYQVGWTSAQGRTVNANHLLLWDGLLKLKNEGVQDLDLGGVNDADAAGVKRFKQGLGGDLVQMAGQFK